MKINKYPDGTSYVVLGKYDFLNESEDVIFRINNYEDLHHLEQLLDVANNLGIKPNIIIPNLIDAQADRRFEINHSSGLKIVLKRLNSMDANFKIFHPHNAEVVEAMMDNVEIIDNNSFIQGVLKHIVTLNSVPLKLDIKNGYKDLNDMILMSADAGGYKPLMKLADKLKWQGETYSASKSRGYVDGKSKLTQLIDRKDFKGKDILIIDDISVYGGTFKGLAKLLRERNCGKLYLAVSHMTIQNLGEDPVTNYFDKVFTTNSKFDEYTYNAKGFGSYLSRINSLIEKENLEIIKIF